MPYNVLGYAAVAQLDRAFGYEPKGCRFKSCQLYQKNCKYYAYSFFVFILIKKLSLHIAGTAAKKFTLF